MTLHPTSRRILIIGTDGMRPDAVSVELMPTYYRLIREGMLFNRFQAAYPSETRVSMTTLTTGVYPGKHGIVANMPYLPGFRNDGFLQTGNHRHLMDYPAQVGEPLVLRPSLGDRLSVKGKHLAIAGGGSSGSSLLWNVAHPQKVINVSTAFGNLEMEAIHHQLGPVPNDEWKRLDWVIRALLEIHLPDLHNEVMVLWFPQPDTASHDYGIGSPAFCESLRWIDNRISQVFQALHDRGEEINVFLISDHGHSTIAPQGSLKEHLLAACRELQIDPAPFAVSGRAIYQRMDVSDSAIEKLILWLKAQPWCGAVLARHVRAKEWGALPSETLLGPLHHERTPLLMVNPLWTPELNQFGVSGISKVPISPGPKAADHGNAVPTEMRAFCLGWGPDFKAGAVSDTPCGIVDIAPTVCHLLGMNNETGFDGRILHEGLHGGPDSKSVKTTFTIEGSDTQRQPLQFAQVNGTRYILGSKADSV